MAHVFTPGLQVMARTIVRKDRTLPIPGRVLVRPGDTVTAEQIIAETEIPNDVQSLNVVNLLSITPKEIYTCMLKKEGDSVKANEPIAQNKPFLGIKFFQTIVRAPFDGSIERISDVTGQVLIRKPPRAITLSAFVDGVVMGVCEGLGAEIETRCAYIQGIFGIGGEQNGNLVVLAHSENDALNESNISEEYRGKIIIGGSHITLKGFRKAMECGVKGIIVGGFNAVDLKDILGYELGVAITGDEDIPTTLIITEGFGRMAMAHRTFDLLRQFDGSRASISGRTQIRAGVMRPEIIVPLSREKSADIAPPDSRTEKGIQIGDEVRIIRQPWFGQLGTILELPSALTLIETEAHVRIMKVRLSSSGEIITVPRANIELIEVS
ncbi:MAG TPA: hypothetical protein PLB62_10220 [Candidatus Sumerlaeota bacterium]|nr:hypothetical protein [Candidatus Sumerlaeota bacterium]